MQTVGMLLSAINKRGEEKEHSILQAIVSLHDRYGKNSVVSKRIAKLQKISNGKQALRFPKIKKE